MEHENQEEIPFIRELLKEKTEKEISEAENNLKKYVDLLWRIAAE